jgi:hypothetical protein
MTPDKLQKLTKNEAIIHESGFSECERKILDFLRQQASVMSEAGFSGTAKALADIANLIEDGAHNEAPKTFN